MKIFIIVMTLSWTLFLNSSVFATSHTFSSPYECLSERTSKRSGKTYTTLHYIHPQKNWLIVLNGVKEQSLLKVANLYTPQGRYDGSYLGSYPSIESVKFGTFWPLNKSKVEMLLSKVNKSGCKVMVNSTIFNIENLNTLECMDPKGTGSCKALGR